MGWQEFVRRVRELLTAEQERSNDASVAPDTSSSSESTSAKPKRKGRAKKEDAAPVVLTAVREENETDATTDSSLNPQNLQDSSSSSTSTKSKRNGRPKKEKAAPVKPTTVTNETASFSTDTDASLTDVSASSACVNFSLFMTSDSKSGRPKRQAAVQACARAKLQQEFEHCNKKFRRPDNMQELSNQNQTMSVLDLFVAQKKSTGRSKGRKGGGKQEMSIDSVEEQQKEGSAPPTPATVKKQQPPEEEPDSDEEATPKAPSPVQRHSSETADEPREEASRPMPSARPVPSPRKRNLTTNKSVDPNPRRETPDVPRASKDSGFKSMRDRPENEVFPALEHDAEPAVGRVTRSRQTKPKGPPETEVARATRNVHPTDTEDVPAKKARTTKSKQVKEIALRECSVMMTPGKARNMIVERKSGRSQAGLHAPSDRTTHHQEGQQTSEVW
ncbi:unnamed protein product [Cyprideis torosa]|uniref:Uncharacterized protein n=1 Tax=Cyprideis torosa TaxID=163714 RepID=A0A7R8ZRC4_9CRUS|nr:unnamed protein product [Cyprideis torosa]CAG0893932.1 unnamed protein product [Cyprideis torosa]